MAMQAANLFSEFVVPRHSWTPHAQTSKLFRRTSKFRIMASLQGDPVKEWIFGEGGASKIIRVSSVGGGCVNNASKYQTDAGSFFVKTNRDIGPAMFEAEAVGLGAMHETNTIRVPKPLKVGPLPGRGSYIIMEYIDFGSSSGQAELGRKLGEMHKVGTSDNGFGFPMDNTIGSTPQQNPWTDDWVSFYREHRLGYQLKLAQQQYRDNDVYAKGQKLLQNLELLFKDVEIKPCLLHGDLWSGNVASDKDGNPVILDPACYYGHNEAEFGMSWCAGFGPSFYNAYFEVMPKQPGFEQRTDLYKLYHYLNHYNMFGSGYRSSCKSILDKYLRLLGLDIGPAMFEAEAVGLGAMHETNTIRVPKPLKVGPLPGRGSYIIMEYIDFGSSSGQAELGRKLGEMHKVGTSDNGFGFPMDNTIGSTPQQNPWTDDWVSFYREHRLGYQLKLAQQQYRDNDVYAKGQKLLQNLELLFKDVEIKPCLLHGDLWSGNVASDKDGNPVILDPACYYGHNEAEFGMSWCAGFGPSFYNAYFEVMPKQPGFEQRTDLYKLYHYLNHYNMFGSGYRSSCKGILDKYLRLLGL